MAGKLEKVAITEKALYQRVNRKMKADGKVLKRARGRLVATLGDYYTVDLTRNCIMDKHVDLEDCGREIGVLQQYEALEGAK
jgi:hypothetical protein